MTSNDQGSFKVTACLNHLFFSFFVLFRNWLCQSVNLGVLWSLSLKALCQDSQSRNRKQHEKLKVVDGSGQLNEPFFLVDLCPKLCHLFLRNLLFK